VPFIERDREMAGYDEAPLRGHALVQQRLRKDRGKHRLLPTRSLKPRRTATARSHRRHRERWSGAARALRRCHTILYLIDTFPKTTEIFSRAIWERAPSITT